MLDFHSFFVNVVVLHLLSKNRFSSTTHVFLNTGRYRALALFYLYTDRVFISALVCIGLLPHSISTDHVFLSTLICIGLSPYSIPTKNISYSHDNNFLQKLVYSHDNNPLHTSCWYHENDGNLLQTTLAGIEPLPTLTITTPCTHHAGIMRTMATSCKQLWQASNLSLLSR